MSEMQGDIVPDLVRKDIFKFGDLSRGYPGEDVCASFWIVEFEAIAVAQLASDDPALVEGANFVFPGGAEELAGFDFDIEAKFFAALALDSGFWAGILFFHTAAWEDPIRLAILDAMDEKDKIILD